MPEPTHVGNRESDRSGVVRVDWQPMQSYPELERRLTRLENDKPDWYEEFLALMDRVTTLEARQKESDDSEQTWFDAIAALKQQMDYAAKAIEKQRDELLHHTEQYNHRQE